MDIKLLSVGARCLVDANIFIYHSGMKAGECTDFLDRVARQEIEAHITRIHALRRTHGLFFNDSINLACADRPGLTDIVTHDTDFQRVPHIISWEPTDV